MASTHQRSMRLRKTLTTALDRARTIDTNHSTRLPDDVVAAIGTENAALFASGVAQSRANRAMRYRDEVARMSLAGVPVADIATKLALSYSYVVALRARLGVGRRR